jgi:hypothetical protein
MSDISRLPSFNVHSISAAIRSDAEQSCALPNGMEIKLTPSIPRRTIFRRFSLHNRGERSLHKTVTIKLDDQEFTLRISGRKGKYKVGGKVGSKKNLESFQNVFSAMKACQDPKEKLYLLNLMISLNPEETKKELKNNDNDLGIFKGLFDQEGRPSGTLSTLGNFESYLAGVGIDPTEMKESITSLYENLKLGLLNNKIYGGKRKRLDFSQSNFASGSAKLEKLKSIAFHSGAAHWNGARSGNITIEDQNIFRNNPCLPPNISHNSSRCTYANADRTMEAGLRFDRDYDSGLPKKISISEGLELGLVTPEKAQELKDQTPPCTEFTPLYVIFRPTQSVADGLADARNIGGRLGVPQNVRDADALAQTIIENLQPGVVPIFVGHSMGGMLARAVGTKHNYASIGFNPLGLGRDVRKFINKGSRGRCKQANDATHAECHPSFVMRGDWVSDGSGSLMARAVVKKSDIGQSYIMEDRSGVTGMFARHNAYAKNLEQHFTDALSAEFAREGGSSSPENPPPQNG